MRVHVEHIFHAQYIYILIGYVFFLLFIIFRSYMNCKYDIWEENCAFRKRENWELFKRELFVANIL